MGRQEAKIFEDEEGSRAGNAMLLQEDRRRARGESADKVAFYYGVNERGVYTGNRRKGLTVAN